MKYIQNLERPSKLEKGSKVVFTLSDGSVYKGKVCLDPCYKEYYIEFYEGNAKVFSELNLEKDSFVENIVGYKPRGTWPETKTLEELDKVLDALFKVNKIEEVSKIEEKKEPKTPSEWDWLLD